VRGRKSAGCCVVDEKEKCKRTDSGKSDILGTEKLAGMWGTFLLGGQVADPG